MTLSLRHPAVLEDLLNYRLLRLQAVSGAPVIRLLEGRYGISRREWRLLAQLAAGGPGSPSALAEQTQLDRPRTSRALAALVAKQLVVRAVQAGDSRRASMALTEAGQALYGAIFPQVAQINAQLVELLDDAMLAALDHALTQLTAHARQLNQALVQDVQANRRAGGSRRVRRAT